MREGSWKVEGQEVLEVKEVIIIMVQIMRRELKEGVVEHTDYLEGRLVDIEIVVDQDTVPSGPTPL